jgi:hypothetical protein
MSSFRTIRKKYIFTVCCSHKSVAGGDPFAAQKSYYEVVRQPGCIYFQGVV